MIPHRPSRSPRPRGNPAAALPHALLRLTTALLLVFLSTACGQRGEITVYAPASLTDAMEEAASTYKKETGVQVDLRFGGSGFLATEIEHGAPADVFIAADIRWFDLLVAKGLIVRETSVVLAWNRLVVVVPRSSLASIPETHNALPILDRIAIGDPEYVPAGRYTAQALKQPGAWEVLEGKFVFTHDVRAALALVERNEVDGGVVYATDAKQSDKVQIAFELPERSHDPIVYPGAVLVGAPHPEAGKAFMTFLSGAGGREIFRSFGLGGN
jgi:molybdate transport system substrate-binding protein